MSNSVHTSITLIFVHKSCSIATAEHYEPILPENYVHIVVLAPDLWIVSVHSGVLSPQLYHRTFITSDTYENVIPEP